MKNKEILQSIEVLLNLGDKNLQKNPWVQREDITDVYFNELPGEIEEAKAEHKKNNAVYLEDELGDILWDYIMLLKTLQRDGYIRDINNVFTHAVEKYEERYDFLDMSVGDEGYEGYWERIKEKQKARLKEKHETYLHGIK